MGRDSTVLRKLLRGTSDANIAFDDLRRLLLKLGFQERVRGSHHIFHKQEIDELINIQRDGVNAKPYQVKQVRNTIRKHHLQVDRYV